MAEHCFFCGHVVEGGAEHRCERCGAFRRARDEKRVRAPCPRCRVVRLVPFALGPVALHACERCKGAFLPASEWDALLDVYAHEPLPEIVISDLPRAEGPARSPYRAAGTAGGPESIDLAPAVRCPTCDEEMERLEFAGISGVVIDVCRAHGVWLDAGELERIVERTKENEAPPPQPTLPPGLRVRPLTAQRQADIVAETREKMLAEEVRADSLRFERAAARAARAERAWGSRPPPATVELGRATGAVLRPLRDLIRALLARVR